MEILTLQFGHFANHVGSHLWNLQDELAACGEDEDDQAVDFTRTHSQTESRGGVKWRPRLVLVDKKGALGANGTDQEAPVLAEVAAAALMWDYGSVTIDADVIPRHAFQEDLAQEAMLNPYWGGYGGDRDDGMGEDEYWEEEDEMDTEQPPPADGYEAKKPPAAAKQAAPSVMKTAAEYDFSETTRTWTDYLKVQMPSSSIHELRSTHHDVTPFATYFDGMRGQIREDEEDVLDMVRRQTELCDQMDAVHMIFDMHDGFSGLSGLVVNWVQEEQPKCGKLLAGVMPFQEEPAPQDADDLATQSIAGPSIAGLDADACTWVSAAFSFANLANTGVDVYTPLAVPLWSATKPSGMNQLRYESFFESSALIASALDTATLPYRLSGNVRASQFLASLMPAHRPTAGLLHAIPMPAPHTDTPFIGQVQPTLATSFFDLASIKPVFTNRFTSLVLRGSEPKRLLQLCKEIPLPAHRFCYVQRRAMPVPVPFPQAFSKDVSSKGLMDEGCARSADSEVEQVPVATHLHAAAEAGRCEALRRMAKMVTSRKRTSWAAAVCQNYGVDEDEFRDVFEIVTEHLECGAASGSEDGDDDAGASD